jgi:hypothetical protein
MAKQSLTPFTPRQVDNDNAFIVPPVTRPAPTALRSPVTPARRPAPAPLRSPVTPAPQQPAPTVSATDKSVLKAKIEEDINKAIQRAKEGDLLRWLGNLCQRWDDERHYEDFSGYESVIKSKFAYLGTVTATRRPFGLQFKVHGVKVAIKCLKKPTSIAVAVCYKL